MTHGYGFFNGVGAFGRRTPVLIAPPYETPAEPTAPPPAGSPTPPVDTPTDPDTSTPEPGVDPIFSEPDRIVLEDNKQTVVRADVEAGNWGVSYIATEAVGPVYWEVTVASSTPRDATLAIGVSNTLMPLNGIPGALPGTIAYWSNGQVWQNNVVIATLPTWGRNDTIGSLFHQLRELGLTKNCTTLNSGNRVGSLASGTGPYYPFVAMYSVGARAAMKFVTSKFSCPLPENYGVLGRPAPYNTVAPSISGSSTVGSTLTVTPGTWVA